MISPDRTTKPIQHPIGTIQMIEPEKLILPNNVPVYELSAGTQELVKIELVFNAGSAHHSNPLTAAFTSGMLQEGTQKHNAREIASAIDDYGAFLETDHDKDFSAITLYTLNRHLDKTLPVVREILTEPTFPEKEWEIMRSNRLDKYRINLGKVNYLAGKRFQELLFNHSRYGSVVNEEAYQSLSRTDLEQFWKEHFRMADAIVLVSGRIDDQVRETIRKVLGSTVPLRHSFEKNLDFSGKTHPVERVQFIEKKDAIQSAIRIGRRLFTKDHPDYFGMKVLSTILGGYFGSRLMRNIREDKGYTYGIGAGVACYRNDGYLAISTEVGADVCEQALAEIYREISILQQESVPREELELVRNYLLGNLLKSFDGPMERMDRFKATHLFGLNLEFYHQYAEAIRNIEADTLQRLANTWLQKDDLIELVVGRKGK